MVPEETCQIVGDIHQKENSKCIRLNQSAYPTQTEFFFFCRTTLTPDVDTDSEAFVFLMPRSLNSYYRQRTNLTYYTAIAHLLAYLITGHVLQKDDDWVKKCMEHEVSYGLVYHAICNDL